MQRVFVLISAMAMVGAPFAAAASEPTCPNPAFTRQAHAAIRAYADADLFSGAVLVAVAGRPVLRQGVGLANRELGVAATPEMKYRIGSITKQFTATAILQLQEAGKLSIDDPISKYYPQAPAAWSKITLRHLLTHTSGIPTYTALPGFFDREGRLPHSAEELIGLTRDKPLAFEPGSKFAYDNSGYILLGYVVEKVSGEHYADYLQQHVFGPLGMSDTGYDDSTRMIAGRAAGYGRGPDGRLRNAPFLDMSVPFSAGALYSTVDDLLVWDQALYAARPLKGTSLTAMFSDYGHHYGFGWQVDRKWDRSRIWHDGGINGFTSSFQRFPEARVTAVALSNQEGGGADKLATDLAGLCLGAKVYPDEAPATTGSLHSYAGYYELSPVAVAKVDVRGAQLVSQIAGQPEVALYPEGGGKFFAKTADIEITFQTDSGGRISGALVKQGSLPMLAKRIDSADAERLAQSLSERQAAHLAAPGAEDALRRVIGELQRGAPDYSRMSPTLADLTRQQLESIKGRLAPLGVIKSVAFQSVGPGGADIFVVAFEHGSVEWRIVLGDGGRIDGLFFSSVS